MIDLYTYAVWMHHFRTARITALVLLALVGVLLWINFR